MLRGSEDDHKLDLFLAPADGIFQDSEYEWSNVRAIGEHKQNPALQLAGYANVVCGRQPGRRFVWEFGAPLDIRQIRSIRLPEVRCLQGARVWSKTDRGVTGVAEWFNYE